MTNHHQAKSGASRFHNISLQPTGVSLSAFTAREHATLAMAADLHTISRITQIWSDRLQLISVYVSSRSLSLTPGIPEIQRIHSVQFFHVNR